jgi:hypothetical protein
MTSKNLQSLKTSESAKRTNLAEWRASRLHEMDLPSGLHVTVRNADMTDLMLSGKLPESVLGVADEASSKDKTDIDLQKIGLELMKKNGPEFKQFLDVITTAALVTPAIGDVQDDTHILLSELDTNDKTAIMNWVNREVPALQSFREGQDEPVAAVQHGDSLRVTPE